jgi:hypothetical protein
MSLPPLLHSPDFWIGFASCFVLLAVLAIVALASISRDLRSVRWPAGPANLPPHATARQGRADRGAALRWPHDDYAANEEGEIRRTDWRREASPLPFEPARHVGGEL